MFTHTNRTWLLSDEHGVRPVLSCRKSPLVGRNGGLCRFLAVILLSVFGVFYAMPLVQATSSDPEAGLPACCRRHGKHHCAMMDQYLKASNSGAPQLRAIPQHCPFYPHSSTTSSLRSHNALASSLAFFAQVVSHPSVHPQVRAVYRLSLDRSRQKRGPPSVSLCA